MLILASNSPRRQQLLRLAGWDYTALPASLDESVRPGEEGRGYVLRLAEAKARHVREDLHGASETDLIVAADTTVVLNEAILGKPADAAEAIEMLVRLRGRPHQVHTGLAVLQPVGNQLISQLTTTTVFMRNYSDEEIRAYVASGDPLDKAGAYAIQYRAFHPVESLEGCYANVVGMPLCRLAEMLQSFGQTPGRTPEVACTSLTGQTCPVYEHFLLAEQSV